MRPARPFLLDSTPLFQFDNSARLVLPAVLQPGMRDEHRPKQDLIHEVAGLRKQILDLKDAMTSRRRVEDALRSSEMLLRTLVDNAPVSLGLFRRDGTLVLCNRPFARMLGYDSPAELRRIGEVLGVFAKAEEQAVLLNAAASEPRGALFRNKNGDRSRLQVAAAPTDDPEIVVLVIFDQAPSPPPAFSFPSA